MKWQIFVFLMILVLGCTSIVKKENYYHNFAEGKKLAGTKWTKTYLEKKDSVVVFIIEKKYKSINDGMLMPTKLNLYINENYPIIKNKDFVFPNNDIKITMSSFNSTELRIIEEEVDYKGKLIFEISNKILKVTFKDIESNTSLNGEYNFKLNSVRAKFKSSSVRK